MSEIERQGVFVADAGGTNTQCAIIDAEKVEIFSLLSHSDPGQSLNQLEDYWVTNYKNIISIKAVHFYGAGVMPNTTDYLAIKNKLSFIFSLDRVNLYSDLLGAGRGLYASTNGWVGILGTGANVGYYNGKEISDRIPPLGYVIGDEGSGFSLGKRLLKDYYRNKIEDSDFLMILKEILPEEFVTIDEVYKKANAKHFISSFSPFIAQYKGHPYFTNLVVKEFEIHRDEFLGSLQDHEEIRYVGSVAYSFADILKQVLSNKNIILTKCQKSPIEGLISFHKKEVEE